jgi:hypothetical protein
MAAQGGHTLPGILWIMTSLRAASARIAHPFFPGILDPDNEACMAAQAERHPSTWHSGSCDNSEHMTAQDSTPFPPGIQITTADLLAWQRGDHLLPPEF